MATNYSIRSSDCYLRCLLVFWKCAKHSLSPEKDLDVYESSIAPNLPARVGDFQRVVDTFWSIDDRFAYSVVVQLTLPSGPPAGSVKTTVAPATLPCMWAGNLSTPATWWP